MKNIEVSSGSWRKDTQGKQLETVCFIIHMIGKFVKNFVSGTTCFELDQEADRIIADGYRPKTLQNMKSQLNVYYQFCDTYRLPTFPADNNQIVRFATFLYKYRGVSPSSINNYISTIRSIHGLLNLQQPDLEQYAVKAFLRGLRARHSRPKKQAVAIDPQMFRAIYQYVDTSDNLQMVAWVVALMGFHLLLRASNLTSTSRTNFDPEVNLTRADFRVHQGIILVHIRWSKTLQYKERKLLIPVTPFTDPDISAKTWFERMINTIPAPPKAPAFCVPAKVNKKVVLQPLSYSQLSRLLKKWSGAAKLPSDRFTSHCLRRGGASWLKQRGVPDSVIKALGDWRSFAFLTYIDSALETRLQAMEAFACEN